MEAGRSYSVLALEDTAAVNFRSGPAEIRRSCPKIKKSFYLEADGA